MQPQQAEPILTAYQLGGVLGVIVFALAGVIVFLFKYNMKQEKLREAERKAELEARLTTQAKHDLESEKLRGDFEARAAKMAEIIAETLKRDRDASLAREDKIREQFAQLLMNVEAEAVKNANQLHEVLSKFYDRFVGPRPRY